MKRALYLCVAFVFVVLAGGSLHWASEARPVEPRATPTVSAALPIPKPVRAKKIVKADPYVGWWRWCEKDWDRVCETDSDCKGMSDPVGLPLFCMRPRWNFNKEPIVKICQPGSFGRARRDVESKRQRAFVDHVCQPPQWYQPESSCWQYKYPTSAKCVGRRWCNPDKLHAFLRLVALRESTWKPYVRHDLSADIKAAKSAWRRWSKEYGWAVDTNRSGDVTKVTKLRRDANQHFLRRARWGTGLGWYGQNAAIAVPAWDWKAPPEILCREVEASEVYLRTARRVWKKIHSGVNCGGEKKWQGSGSLRGDPMPTWADVHQGVARGNVCPLPPAAREDFARRAEREGLDPDEPITLQQLGEPIPKDRQNKIAAAIRGSMPTI